MSRADAVRELVNQSPAWANAYLWTFAAFMALCFVLGFIEHRRK